MNKDWPVMSREAAEQIAENMLHQYGRGVVEKVVPLQNLPENGYATTVGEPVLRHSFDEVENMPVELPYNDILVGEAAAKFGSAVRLSIDSETLTKWREAMQEAIEETGRQLVERARGLRPVPHVEVVEYNGGQAYSLKITGANVCPTFTTEANDTPGWSYHTPEQIQEEAGCTDAECYPYYDTVSALQAKTALTDAETYELHTLLCKLATPFYHGICAFDLAKALYLALLQQEE